MKPGLRDIGLLLLGIGVLILSFVVLHFYIVEVLPSIEPKPQLSAYCEDINGELVVHVSNYGRVPLYDVNVESDGKLICHYKVLYPESREVCVFEKGRVFRVSGTYDGKEITISDVCRKRMVVLRD